MLVYRLSKEKYKDQLSGKGAAFRGGRWNSKGTEIIYAAENRALAMAEVAVYASVQTIPNSYWMLTIQLPEVPDIFQIHDLPESWNSFPHIISTKYIGDQLVSENTRLSLKVPSAVVNGDWNVLINPNHSLFDKVKIIDAVAFHFDRRLF